MPDQRFYTKTNFFSISSSERDTNLSVADRISKPAANPPAATYDSDFQYQVASKSQARNKYSLGGGGGENLKMATDVEFKRMKRGK